MVQNQEKNLFWGLLLAVILVPGLLFSDNLDSFRGTTTSRVVFMEDGRVESCVPSAQSNNPAMAARAQAQHQISEFENGIRLRGESRQRERFSENTAGMMNSEQAFESWYEAITEGRMNSRVVDQWDDQGLVCIKMEYTAAR